MVGTMLLFYLRIGIAIALFRVRTGPGNPGKP